MTISISHFMNCHIESTSILYTKYLTCTLPANNGPVELHFTHHQLAMDCHSVALVEYALLSHPLQLERLFLQETQIPAVERRYVLKVMRLRNMAGQCDMLVLVNFSSPHPQLPIHRGHG